MEFANSVVTLIGNIFSCGLILAFLIGVIYGIRFMLQIKQQLRPYPGFPDRRYLRHPLYASDQAAGQGRI